MPLTLVAFIPPGCSSQCRLSLIAKSNRFAFASAHSILLYQIDNRTLPNVGDSNPTAASAPDYRIASSFGSGTLSEIISFDYNDEFIACLTAQKPWVMVWRLPNGECITKEKLPASLGNLFQREGRPTTLCVAGKNHLLFGTSTGRMISLNTNASDKIPAEPRSVVIPAATSSLQAPSAQNGKPANNSSDWYGATAVTGGGQKEAAESVECVAVSPVRADLVACGTSDGTLSFLTLSATTGLTHTASIAPFPSPLSKEKDSAPFLSGPLPVSVIAFDVSVANQLVVGSREGGLVLCDTNNHKAPTLVFDCKECVSAIAWVPGKTGTFFTVNCGSNLVHKWQTSSKTALAILPFEASVGIRSIAHLDSDRVALGFTHGGLAVYNLTHQQYEFQTEGGSTHTALCCRTNRHDRDHVASAGVDGVIRVWNMRTLGVLYKIEVSGEVAVHDVDWLSNGKYLVAALSSGEVVQYTCSTQRQGWRTPVFGGPVGRILWLPASTDSTSLVVAIASIGIALLGSKNGQVLHRFSAPGGAILSLDVEPTKGKTLAVGCADGKIYLFNLLSQSDKPILTLTGHCDAVNDIAFHPSAPQFLLSGGHDSMLRVWDLAPNDSHVISVKSRVLRGHQGGVQSVCWCGVAPYLALSGSADTTVGLWDVRGEGRCLGRLRRHAAGISAICSHPERPLIVYSLSRDGAIVAWSLSLLSHLFLKATLDVLEPSVVPDASELMLAEPAGGLSVGAVAGNPVRNLLKELSQAAAKPIERIGKLLGFFEFPQGCWDVMQLASYANDPSSYVPDAKANIVPLAKLLEAQKVKAKQMHDKAHGKTVASVGPAYRKKRLLESANELLKVGQFEDYCNALIEAEAWDQAIVVAPIVSREYWRSVCAKAAAVMEGLGDPRAVTYYILAEESAKAAQVLTHQKGSRSAYDEAVTICLTCPQRDPNASPAEVSKPTGLFNANEPPIRAFIDAKGTTTVTQVLQNQRLGALLRSRSPRVVAALHLASGGNDEAIRSLLYAGESALAHALLHIIPVRERNTIDAVYFASILLCARLGLWEVGLLCAARHSNPYHPLATLFSLFQDAQGRKMANATGVADVLNPTLGTPQASSDAVKHFRDQIRAKCESLKLSLDPAIIQQKHASDGMSSQNQIAAMVLQAVDPAHAGGGAATPVHVLQSICGFLENLLEVALRDINGADANFYLKQAFNVTGYVALPGKGAGGGGEAVAAGPPPGGLLTGLVVAPPSPSSSSALTADHRRFLALSFLLAALMGVKVYRFPHLLNPAFARAREFAKGSGALEGLVGKVQGVLANYSPHSALVECLPPGTELATFGGDGKLLTSALTSVPIYGEAFALEDGGSFIAKKEALEWGLCCHFTMSGTGVRMLVG